MRLLLIRHGQTPSNVMGALDTAVPGPGLTDLGREQAAALPSGLAGQPIDVIYASTQTRAQMTAGPLADERGLEVLVRDGLREVGAGELEMRSDWDAVLEYHRISFSWVERGDVRMPGGETGAEVLSRFDGVVREAERSGARTAALVAHGQIIRLWAAARVAEVDVEYASEHPLQNTGIVVVDGSSETGWSLVRWSASPLGGQALSNGASGGPGGVAAEA